MSQLANLVTALSLLCGFISVILSFEGYFVISAYAIMLSVILDGLDGRIARKNKISSDFGKEFDSLVDVVSFGIAPVLLGYTFFYFHFHFLVGCSLFLYLFSSVLRLTKYNIDKSAKSNCFTGLPTTVGGGVLASFVLIYGKRGDLILFKFTPVTFMVLVLILAYLMVSRARYLNLDGLQQLFGKRLKWVVLFLFIILSLALYWDKIGAVLFFIFLIYLLFSPFMVKRLSSF